MVMQRCVAIHANGTSEVLEFQPQVHHDLRRLGYRRFVVQTADGRALSSAVYARTTPSSWQFSDAAKKLWGLTGEVQVFDEHGEPVRDTLTPASGSPAIPPAAETRVAQTAFVEGSESEVRKAGVGRETPVAPAPGIPREGPARPRTRVDPRQIPELIARANHSLPDADPRKITRAMIADVARAARAMRLNADEGLGAGMDEAQQRALADRLESHARALGSYLR
jgi:hypothetical protein